MFLPKYYLLKFVNDSLEASDLVRKARQRLEMTQEQFFFRLSVTFPIVILWKRGRAKSSPIAQNLFTKVVEQMNEAGAALLGKYSVIKQS